MRKQSEAKMGASNLNKNWYILGRKTLEYDDARKTTYQFNNVDCNPAVDAP